MAAAAKLEYRNVSDHVEDLASGRTLAPGEAVTLTKDDLREHHNENLIFDGRLIPINDKAEEEAKLARQRAGRRASGEAEDVDLILHQNQPEEEEGGN